MLRQTVVVLTVFTIIINQIHRTRSFKTKNEYNEQFKKVQDDFSASDHLVGKAMDFIYSNKTVMSLLARELWNVGASAIDKIVSVKDPKPSPKAEIDKLSTIQKLHPEFRNNPYQDLPIV